MAGMGVWGGVSLLLSAVAVAAGAAVAPAPVFACHSCNCTYPIVGSKSYHDLTFPTNKKSCKEFCEKKHPTVAVKPFSSACFFTPADRCIFPCPEYSSHPSASVCSNVSITTREECVKLRVPKFSKCEVKVDKATPLCNECYECNCEYVHGLKSRIGPFGHIVDDAFCQKSCPPTHKISIGCSWNGTKCGIIPCESGCKLLPDSYCPHHQGHLQCKYDSTSTCGCSLVKGTKVGCNLPEPPPNAPVYQPPSTAPHLS